MADLLDPIESLDDAGENHPLVPVRDLQQRRFAREQRTGYTATRVNRDAQIVARERAQYSAWNPLNWLHGARGCCVR